MTKYFLHLAYNGTKYRGWQRQLQVPTVQATVEDTISKMLGYKITCKGCGRTDAGVHASQFFCHFRVETPFTYDPIFRLNKMLPSDIRVYDVIEVAKNAKAQLHVIERSYTYYIHGVENPFLPTMRSYYPISTLDMEKMVRATALLKGVQDFRFFCKQPDLYDTTICKVSMVYWKEPTRGRLEFCITADRFLRGMIRIVVANLLAVGYGELTISDITKAINLEQALPIRTAAYPQGLYLSKVRYEYLDIASNPIF